MSYSRNVIEQINVEVGKLDDLVTLRSIGGRNFPDFEMLDAKIASVLSRIISDQCF